MSLNGAPMPKPNPNFAAGAPIAPPMQNKPKAKLRRHIAAFESSGKS
jgi:hypothetical protein